MNLASTFSNSLRKNRKTVALRWKAAGRWNEMSYGDLGERVEDWTRALQAAGVALGDRVALLSPNRPEWVFTDLATVTSGAVLVPIYATSALHTVRYVLEHSEAKLLFCAGTLLNLVKEAARDLRNLQQIVCFDDGLDVFLGRGNTETVPTLEERSRTIRGETLATIIYTSGTTGSPKGVMLTHKNLTSNCEASIQCFPVVSSDRTLSFLPLSHALERTAGLYLMLANGVAISFAEDLTTVPQNLLEVRPTVITSVPRVLEKFHARIQEALHAKPLLIRLWIRFAIRRATERGRAGLRRDFLDTVHDHLFFRKIRDRLGGNLRLIVSGGAALSPDIMRFFQAVGFTILEGYGLTESSPVISVNRVDANKVGTVGQPIPGVEVRIAPDGEILARGPNIMLGYFKDPVATSEAIDSEGFLHTGDIGELDSEGFLKITDRKKEIIVTSGGKKVAPQPMENELKIRGLIGQVCLLGDARNYLTALIVPEFQALESRARAAGLPVEDRERLVDMPEVHRWFQEIVDQFNADRAPYETIKKFKILFKEWTVESAEMTPTMKLRRKEIVKNHSRAIEDLYRG